MPPPAPGAEMAPPRPGRRLGGQMGVLSEHEMRVLAFERSWWRSPGAKEQEILDALGMTATRYYQLLNELIDRPEALVFDPALVTRLRRQRAKRHRLRSASPDRGDGGS